MAARTQRLKALFFVHDGGGLGHVRRLSRIADALGAGAACLFLCGHRSAAWILSERCEYLHLPPVDSLQSARAAHWGREPFLDLTKAETLAFRAKLIHAAFAAFDPDVLIVDYLPAGRSDELLEIIRETRARRVFILRGILRGADALEKTMLHGPAGEHLEKYYDSVLVACDRRVWDAGAEYKLPPSLAEKLKYIGYVAPRPDPAAGDALRRARRPAPGGRWVVCSAGSGKAAEELTLACVALAREHAAVAFDIVTGPSSRLRPEELAGPGGGGRVRVHREARDLAAWHAAADVVILEGGYNSLVEAIRGRAEVIVCPVQPGNRSEQLTHARRLGAFVPLTIVENLADLGAALAGRLGAGPDPAKSTAGAGLDFDGAARAAAEILALAAAPTRPGG